jgi:hypothetical protein
MPVPFDCSASFIPLPGLPLAAEIECPVCRRRVVLQGPPPEGSQDLWAGSRDNRIAPHWSRKMPEG